jgi:hypothetical protein
LSIGNIDITKAIEDARSALEADSSISKETRAIMNILIIVVSLLSEKLGLNSSNSSKPPSNDPFRKKNVSAKKNGAKKPPEDRREEKERKGTKRNEKERISALFRIPMLLRSSILIDRFDLAIF